MTKLNLGQNCQGYIFVKWENLELKWLWSYLVLIHNPQHSHGEQHQRLQQEHELRELPGDGQAEGEHVGRDQVEFVVLASLRVEVQAHGQELREDERQGEVLAQAQRELNTGHLRPGNERMRKLVM